MRHTSTYELISKCLTARCVRQNAGFTYALHTMLTGLGVEEKETEGKLREGTCH